MGRTGSAALAAALVLVVVALGYVLALARPAAQHPQAGAGGVELLEETEYYTKLYELVSEANKSVYVMMFVIKYDPDDPDDPVNSLLALLCAKASKGLDVKVLVDDVTTKDYPWTIAYLKSCGVKVKVWKSRANLHAKVVIVDEEHLLLGSHNWTESALRYNVEVSVYTRSPGAVREALNLFNKLWALASSA